MKNCPYKEPWTLLLAYSIIKWLRDNNEYDKFYTSSLRVEVALSEIQDLLFNTAYSNSGSKPIGKCTTEELEAELNRRKYDTK